MSFTAKLTQLSYTANLVIMSYTVKIPKMLYTVKIPHILHSKSTIHVPHKLLQMSVQKIYQKISPTVEVPKMPKNPFVQQKWELKPLTKKLLHPIALNSKSASNCPANDHIYLIPLSYMVKKKKKPIYSLVASQGRCQGAPLAEQWPSWWGYCWLVAPPPHVSHWTAGLLTAPLTSPP